jgi:hypothetical protein
MNKRLELSALALLAAAAAATANAQTNLLQSVSVEFVIYSQGPTNVVSGRTNYTVNDSGRFGTRELIGIVSSNGYHSGDVLARATPVTNVAVEVTNLVPIFTNIVVISNASTSLEAVTNELSISSINGGAFANIGNDTVTFGANTTTNLIDGATVAVGTNTATYGPTSQSIGTNTTVTTITLTNADGYAIGTSNIFISYNLETSSTATNKLGTPSWVIYNDHNGKPAITPISTNLLFDIRRDLIYGLTNSAYVHGETIRSNNVIRYGTTDEIRTLLLSNGVWNIRLQGYAHGRVVSVSLGGTDVVYSQDYTWDGDGSGATTNSTPIILDGDIREMYFKYLK